MLVDGNYLKALPTDPYKNQSLRYVPDKWILYTVGPDGIDQGGTSADKLKKRKPNKEYKEKDPTYVIPFKPWSKHYKGRQ